MNDYQEEFLHRVMMLLGQHDASDISVDEKEWDTDFAKYMDEADTHLHVRFKAYQTEGEVWIQNFEAQFKVGGIEGEHDYGEYGRRQKTQDKDMEIKERLRNDIIGELKEVLRELKKKQLTVTS